MDADNKITEQMLKRSMVCELFATSSSGLHRGMVDGRYPKPYRIGSNSVRWKLSECLETIDRLQVAEPVPVAPGSAKGRKSRRTVKEE